MKCMGENGEQSKLTEMELYGAVCNLGIMKMILIMKNLNYRSLNRQC
jgi:hypothetical protein